ncbi:hypothetical protein [Methylotetracoccus oryzae]|uniref:hypothetical protein n=1 Tax=Methylotetracoccus oryzae TaxID=1919059 RepID=UPI00111B47D4|nr:hypothetical protein [Methylotetracoccus oryzae]
MLAIGAAIVFGCTSIRTRTLEKGDVTMTKEQFATQFERVFRYHNSVMNNLINVSAELEESSPDGSAVSEAEAIMDEACEPLNEVVAAESVSEDVSFETMRLLPRAVPECEAATRRVEVLLLDVLKTQESSRKFVAR